MRRYFRVDFQPVSDAPVWHPDVETYDVLKGEQVIGRVHLDMHPRPHKYTHAQVLAMRFGKRGGPLPEGALVCNFPKPSEGDPALMEIDQLSTFVHELVGHLNHLIVGGHTEWGTQSGFQTEFDFVEAPAQLAEALVGDVKTLQTFAYHHEKKDGDGNPIPIPAELVERMKNSAKFGRGLAIGQSMLHAALSLKLHDRSPDGLSFTELETKLTPRYTGFEYVPGASLLPSFLHLRGYGSKYYTYDYSKAIALALAAPFKRSPKGFSDQDLWDRYTQTVIEHGGDRPALDSVEEFTGEPFNLAPFKAYLDEYPEELPQVA